MHISWDILYQYRDSHYKDKTVSWPSYLYNGNSNIWKDRLYVETGPCKLRVVTVFMCIYCCCKTIDGLLLEHHVQTYGISWLTYINLPWPNNVIWYHHRLNSSWPSATYMRRDFQCLFPQRPGYVALISMLISPVPHIWGVTNGSLLASPPNSRRSPASLISPAPHIWGASRTPIITRVVWKISNVVIKILVVLPDYRLPSIVAAEINGKIYTICCNLAPFIVYYQTLLYEEMAHES